MEIDYAVLTLKIKGEPRDYKVIYDNPLFNKQVFDAFESWAAQTDDYSDESLVAFIKSKYPGMNCLTESRFNQLLKDHDLTVILPDPDKSQN